MHLDKKDKVLLPLFCGLLAFLSALCGFGLVLLAMKFESRLLFVIGYPLVIIGIAAGFITIIYGWWRTFRPKRKAS